MVTMTVKLQKLGEILKPGPHDVLCGRGNRINGYKGNRLFQQVVKRTRIEYVAVTKRDKRTFATHLVRAINALDPPGKFLKTEEVNGQLKYVEMDEKAAVVKSRQALREGAPEIEKSLKAGVIKPRTGDMASLVREEVLKVYQPNNYVNAQDQIYRTREVLNAEYANQQEQEAHTVKKKETATLGDKNKNGASPVVDTNVSARQMSHPQPLPSPSFPLQLVRTDRTGNALKEEKKQGEDRLSLILGGGHDLPVLEQQLVDKRRILQQAIQLQEDHANRIMAAQAYRELQFQLLKNNHVVDPVALSNILERNVMMDNKLSAEKCRLERAMELLLQRRDHDSFQSTNPKFDRPALEPDELTVNKTPASSVDDKDKILAAVSLCSLFSSTKSENKVKNEESIPQHTISNCAKPGQPPISTSSDDMDTIPSQSPFSKRSREIESDSLDQSLNESLEQQFSGSSRKKMKVHGSVPLGRNQDAVIGQSYATRNDSSMSKLSEEHRSVAPIVEGFYLQNGSQGLVSLSEVQNPRITIKTEIYFHPPN
ncbi:hypothetical protein CTEN210_03480 [Chaetoceros tenuissimus]|uniref:DUF6824 domain-containing protein n=1 Tax=Chaetoceros tenuissimus TaxID=426638 RepID=A0AAD3CKZ4_9STRA|nr:hypothetical protein CTEN210_03480 [Chaetoceros tenuissimus]